MTDKSGIFKDFNFKLIVINDILEKSPSFEKSLEELKDKYIKDYEWYTTDKPIKEMVDFFEKLVLTQEDLNKVELLSFDGGEDIYFLLKPDWDGEDDIFDVTSVEGFEKLPNLKKVEYIAMCDPKLLDKLKERGIDVI